MTAATALNNAQKAALAAEFGKVYKGTRVKQNVADALVARLASKGDSLMDINDVLTLEADDEATWRAIWSQIFAEAGLKDASDLERFAKWARARGTDAGAGIALHGHAQSRRAIEVLETNGMTVTSAIRTELEAVLAQGEAGSEREQCCCALTGRDVGPMCRLADLQWFCLFLLIQVLWSPSTPSLTGTPRYRSRIE